MGILCGLSGRIGQMAIHPLWHDHSENRRTNPRECRFSVGGPVHFVKPYPAWEKINRENREISHFVNDLLTIHSGAFPRQEKPRMASLPSGVVTPGMGGPAREDVAPYAASATAAAV
jgi:hypothetical protein